MKKSTLIRARILIVFMLIMCGLLLPGCGNQENPSAPVELKAGTWKTAQTIQPFLYGQFLPAGYNLEVSPFTNPGDMKAALIAGQLDFCGSTLVTAITAASKGEPVVVVSSLCNKCSALVVRQDSSIQTAADLKGKKIAYVPGTMHHLLLLETLRKAGLDPDHDVVLIRIDFFDMGQALSQGSVDAFCSGEPYPSLAVSEGYGRILSYPYFNDSVGTINACMLTTRSEIDNHRDYIQQLVSAHAKSTEYLKSHPQEWLNKAGEFGTSADVLKIAAGNIELSWEMDQHYIDQSALLAQKMKELGVISEVPDMNQLFDLSFVEQASKDLQ